MFTEEPWHGSERFVDEVDADWDWEDPKQRSVYQHQEVPTTKGLYLWWVKQKEAMKQFEPALVPQYLPGYEEAVGLTEIGVTRQIMQESRTSMVGSEARGGGSSIGEVLKEIPSGVWKTVGVVAGIATGLLFLPGGPGNKGKAVFQMAKYPWFAINGKLGEEVAKMMEKGAVPHGNEIIQEEIPPQWYNYRKTYGNLSRGGWSPGG